MTSGEVLGKKKLVRHFMDSEFLEFRRFHIYGCSKVVVEVNKSIFKA